MTNSSNNSKPAASRKVSPLALLLEELRVAEPTAQISVQQARVLIASLINLQNVVVSIMDTVDKNTETMNQSHENTNQNFCGIVSALKQLGRHVGLDIHGIAPEVDEATEVPPPGTIKH